MGLYHFTPPWSSSLYPPLAPSRGLSDHISTVRLLAQLSSPPSAILTAIYLSAITEFLLC
eukprot:4140143-Pyramimonas_sp.AAC.1